MLLKHWFLCKQFIVDESKTNEWRWIGKNESEVNQLEFKNLHEGINARTRTQNTCDHLRIDDWAKRKIFCIIRTDKNKPELLKFYDVTDASSESENFRNLRFCNQHEPSKN